MTVWKAVERSRSVIMNTPVPARNHPWVQLMQVPCQGLEPGWKESRYLTKFLQNSLKLQHYCLLRNFTSQNEYRRYNKNCPKIFNPAMASWDVKQLPPSNLEDHSSDSKKNWSPQGPWLCVTSWENQESNGCSIWLAKHIFQKHYLTACICQSLFTIWILTHCLPLL